MFPIQIGDFVPYRLRCTESSIFFHIKTNLSGLQLEENVKPASCAATERAFILAGGSFGHSGTVLLLSGFNKFSIMNDEDFNSVVIALSYPALGPGRASWFIVCFSSVHSSTVVDGTSQRLERQFIRAPEYATYR